MGDNHSRFSKERLLNRSCEALLGICQGVLADEMVNEKEVIFVELWLSEHREITRAWPGSVVAEHIHEMLKSGTITAEKLSSLQRILERMLGGAYQDTGAVDGLSSRLPIQEGVAILFPSKVYCFTGKFHFGSRRMCELEIIARQGIVTSNITMELDYLVIGSLVTRDWANTSFGRKIEKAVRYRGKNPRIQIVSEQMWVQALK